MILTLPRRFAAALVVGAALALSACAAPQSAGPAAPDEVPTPARTEYFGDPVDNSFVVRYGDTELHLAPLGEDQLDSPLRAERPAVAADELYVFIGPSGRTLGATQLTGEDPRRCGQRAAAPELNELGDGWWSVRPIGPAGEHTLVLDAWSPEGEVMSMTAYIALQTSQDRPLPPPVTSLSMVAYENEPGWVELNVHGLLESPDTLSAALTLTSEDGTKVSVALSPVSGCRALGDVQLKADLSAADAGIVTGQFDYDLELVRDGETHRAHGSGSSVETLSPAFTPGLG